MGFAKPSSTDGHSAAILPRAWRKAGRIRTDFTA